MPADAVAIVGDRIITRQAFEQELSQRRQIGAGRYADSKARAELLDELIRVEVMHQKALAAGYDQDPQVAANLKQMIVTRFQEDQLSRLPQTTISPDEIAAYYQTHPERFGTPEQVRIALIEFKVPRTATPEKRADVLRTAEAVLAEARATGASNQTFGLLSQYHSEDQASRYRGGDLGWLTAKEISVTWPSPVMEAVSRLAQPGDLSPVVETPTAYYLLKLIARQPASRRPVQQVQAGIEYLVSREKARKQEEAMYLRLQHGLDVRINQALLESLNSTVPLPSPPTLSGQGAAPVPSKP